MSASGSRRAEGRTSGSRWRCFAAAATAFMCLLPGSAAHAGELTTPGELTVGSDLSYPPYDYLLPGGIPAGLDVELVSELAARMGLHERILDTRFENLILGLKSARYDVVVSTLYVTGERAKVVDFVPYLRTGVSIAVSKASGLSFTAPAELCGRRVGSIKGAAWLGRLSALGTSECRGNPVDSREFPTSAEATQALLSGGVDAQIEDSAVLQEASDRLGGRILVSSKGNLYPVVVGMAVRKGDEDLARRLEAALAALQADGSYDRLLVRHNVSHPTEAEVREALAR